MAPVVVLAVVMANFVLSVAVEVGMHLQAAVVGVAVLVVKRQGNSATSTNEDSWKRIRG